MPRCNCGQLIAAHVQCVRISRQYWPPRDQLILRQTHYFSTGNYRQLDQLISFIRSALYQKAIGTRYSVSSQFQIKRNTKKKRQIFILVLSVRRCLIHSFHFSPDVINRRRTINFEWQTRAFSSDHRA